MPEYVVRMSVKKLTGRAQIVLPDGHQWQGHEGEYLCSVLGRKFFASENWVSLLGDPPIEGKDFEEVVSEERLADPFPDHYAGWTKEDLRLKCNERGIEFSSWWTKGRLIEALTEAK